MVDTLITDCTSMIDDFDRMGPVEAARHLAIILNKIAAGRELAYNNPDLMHKLKALEIEAIMISDICIHGYPNS